MHTSSAEIITDPVPQIACAECQHPLNVSGLPAFTEIACPECHTPQIVPARLGGFILRGLLGQGGMGAVYEGYDESLNRPVAVKVLLAALSEDADFVETFRREAQAAAALNHPNIVQIYSFGVAHGQTYMAMELLTGGRFDQIIAGSEPVNEALAVRICADVAEGLNAASAIGLVHGDVKPENILLDPNGLAKIVDFGLARFKDRGAAVDGVWGTPYYIAPEKVRRLPGDLRSDLYSLGATLFHALAGKPPFDGDTPVDVVKARLTAPAPLLRTLRPDAHPEVEAIVARMLQPEPGKRYPTYASLLADLRRVLAILKPPDAPFGPTVKRGGKIILTRKKGARTTGKVTTGRMENLPGLAIDSGTARALEAGAAAGAPKRPRSKLAVTLGIVGGVLLLLLAVGGGWFGFRAAKEKKARAEAAEEAQARIQEFQQQAEQAAGLIWATAVSAGGRSKSTEQLGITVSNMQGEVTGLAQKLTNPEAVSNAVAAAVEAGRLAQADIIVAVTSLTELVSLTNAANSHKEAVVSAGSAADAAAAFGAITNIGARAAALEKAIKAAQGRVEKQLAALQEQLKKLALARTDELSDAQRKAAETAAAQRQALAEETAKRDTETKAATAEKELAAIKEARTANASLVQQNKFEEAAEAFKTATASLATDEGKQAAAAVAEGYALMLELKQFLIKAITVECRAKPDGIKYGWLVNGVPTLDVLGADNTQIRIRGRTAPWDQVSPPQMLRFIKRYVIPDLPRKQRGQVCLAAAVYFYDAGAGAERALKLATEYASEAVKAAPELTSKLKTVLPDVTLEAQ